MIDYRRIYLEEAERYAALVSREDAEGNLLPAIESICGLPGLNVVELGAGTGRLTRLLVPIVDGIFAFDRSAHMLSFAQQHMPKEKGARCHFGLGDNRHLPIRSGKADMVIAGWSVGHMVGWYPASWQQQIGLILAGMKRVLRPGGMAIIIETLGTGREDPQPPSEGLAAYYSWLEEAHGFLSTWIRTDYRFHSLQEAVELTSFFFGKEVIAHIRENSYELPECTGLWWFENASLVN